MHYVSAGTSLGRWPQVINFSLYVSYGKHDLQVHYFHGLTVGKKLWCMVVCEYEEKDASSLALEAVASQDERTCPANVPNPMDVDSPTL